MDYLHQRRLIRQKEDIIAAFDFLPKDVVADIIFGQISWRCVTCKAGGLKEIEWVVPVDLCKYHEHRDERERAACKGLRVESDSDCD